MHKETPEGYIKAKKGGCLCEGRSGRKNIRQDWASGKKGAIDFSLYF